jgi:hypothetical protein
MAHSISIKRHRLSGEFSYCYAECLYAQRHYAECRGTYDLMWYNMDRLKLMGQNLGQVINSRSRCMFAMHLCSYYAKLSNLKLKTLTK